MNKEIRTKISPPWFTFVSELKALFGEDPDIKIEHTKEFEVKMYVADANKAAALSVLMPYCRTYGNVDIIISIIPPNREQILINDDDYTELFNAAFKNNPALSYIQKIEGLFEFKATYIVFKNKVVQYFNDNLNDINGNTSTLYEDIARDIFKDTVAPGNFFCTDVVDNKLKKPLGEWP